MRDGAAWEQSTVSLNAAISKNSFKRNMIGTKQSKKQQNGFSAQKTNFGPDETTEFKALADRANYLALDCPDIAFTTNALCRSFAHPAEAVVDQLRRCVRYLIGHPRLVWHFLHQPDTSTIKSSLDTDFAGCTETRGSTSRGVACRGHHLVKHWSTTQTTVTLSSAEAEPKGIRKGASISLGLQRVANDFGFDLQLSLC